MKKENPVQEKSYALALRNLSLEKKKLYQRNNYFLNSKLNIRN
jgi:hypothetical protein